MLEKDTGENYEEEPKKYTENVDKEAFTIKNEILKFKVGNIVSDAIMPIFSLSRENRIEIQNKIVDYIVGGNLNSNKDPSLEKKIIEYSKNSRKLKYLLDNSGVNLEKNLSNIMQIEKEQEKEKKILANNREKLGNGDESLLKKGGDWLIGKVKGLLSHLVNLTDVPEKIGGVIGDVLARAEKLIGQTYVRGTMDCSMFLSKIFCAGQGIKEQRLGMSEDFAKYEEVSKDRIMCGDVMYQAPTVVMKNGKKISKPGHVELIVSKPYVENGITYVNTIGSSRDTSRVDPMFDANGKAIINKTGVGYRKRQIAPNPNHAYRYHRPPYEERAKNRTQKTTS